MKYLVFSLIAVYILVGLIFIFFVKNELIFICSKSNCSSLVDRVPDGQFQFDIVILGFHFLGSGFSSLYLTFATVYGWILPVVALLAQMITKWLK
jgi:hypothetical protein